MAHDLRKISNKGYNCYGSGRDWFFLGDPNYREGARTPLPNQGGPQLEKPAARPRGVPREVSHQRSVCGAKARTREKWQKIRDETPNTFGPQQLRAMGEEPLARTTGGRGARSRRSADTDSAPAFATTYDQLGRHPKWTGERYTLDNAEVMKTIGVPKSSSEPVLKEMEGDHTRGIRGTREHFSSTYQQIGNVPGMPARRYEVYNAEMLRDACIPPKVIPQKERQGDHSQGVKGPTADTMHTTYTEVGQQPLPQWMGSRRIQHHRAEELRDAGVPPPDGAPKQNQGDHSCGIHGEMPHHFTTSQQYGHFQKFDGKRYDFGPVAFKQYRLTKWS